MEHGSAKASLAQMIHELGAVQVLELLGGLVGPVAPEVSTQAIKQGLRKAQKAEQIRLRQELLLLRESGMTFVQISRRYGRSTPWASNQINCEIRRQREDLVASSWCFRAISNEHFRLGPKRFEAILEKALSALEAGELSHVP
jgi:hypothetical protein